MSRRTVTFVHSSDLHVDDGPTARANGGDGTAPLRLVLDAAHAAKADFVVLAGDVFEHNRLPDDLLARAAALLRAAAMPVVLLPGNHDPAMRGSVWYRGAVPGGGHVHVLGVTSDTVVLEALDLEIWGRPHMDYGDMAPLAVPHPRSTQWQVAAAHGHYTDARPEAGRPAAGWLITDAEIAATGSDYVALGHWNQATPVGSGGVPAFYSGSPDYAQTVNVVRLAAGAPATVSKLPIKAKAV